jgi:hypothetical protein
MNERVPQGTFSFDAFQTVLDLMQLNMPRQSVVRDAGIAG